MVGLNRETEKVLVSQTKKGNRSRRAIWKRGLSIHLDKNTLMLLGIHIGVIVMVDAKRTEVKTQSASVFITYLCVLSFALLS